MALDCVQVTDDGLPDKIIDLATLTVNLNNQGLATLTVTILTTDETIPLDVCEFELGRYTFKGVIKSDQPQKLSGSKYTEHRITAIGLIC